MSDLKNVMSKPVNKIPFNASDLQILGIASVLKTGRVKFVPATKPNDGWAEEMSEYSLQSERTKHVTDVKAIPWGKHARDYSLDTAIGALNKRQKIVLKDKRYQRKSILKALDDKVTRDTIFRGMGAPEARNALRQGKIESKGAYNFDNQKGVTFYSNRPSQAESYAGSFAPWQHQPTYTEPSYVFEVDRPSADHIRANTYESSEEVGVEGSIPTSNIKNIYELRVLSEQAGYIQLREEKNYDNKTVGVKEGSRSGPRQTLVYRKVPKIEWSKVARPKSKGGWTRGTRGGMYKTVKGKKIYKKK
jgi:hypothetical protein